MTLRRTRVSGEQKAVTIADVAAAAGVTTATVSYAFSGKRFVAPETRETVLRAARSLGYAPNPHAVRLANGRVDDLIALFTLTLDHGVGTSKLLLVQQALHAAGWRAPIHGYDYHAAAAPGEQVALMRDLRAQRPRAIVCATAGVHPDALEELRRFHEEGGLVVYLRYGDPVENPVGDQVVFDDEDNAYRAARHLLEIGHRRLGFFKAGPFRHYGPRLDGFRRALAEFGAPYREEWHFFGGSITLEEESGRELAGRWMALPEGERPTGLCVVNDRTAQGFVVELFEAGRAIPEDVSVVGCDDLPAAAYGRVPLTTVTHPVREMARSVVDTLLARIGGGDFSPPRKIVHRGELVVRASTRPLT
jgi:LacI family transcriptional regulator